MAKKKQRVCNYKRRYPTNLVLEEVLDIINEVIDTVSMNTTNPHFGFHLARKGLYHARLDYWETNYPEVVEAMNVLRAISKEKIQFSLLDNTINTTGAIFLLKCNYGFVEKDKLLKIESDKDIAEINNDTVINIGFNDGED